ncbi:MAG: HEAT repeat domain-containing protein [Candidatus Heimdallarchaeota archaeon]
MSKIPIDRNIPLLNDANPNVRRSAVEALGRKMNKGSIKPLINLYNKEDNIDVRRAIVLAISFIGGEEIIPILLDVLKNEKDADTRRNAAGGLRFFSKQVKAEVIFKILLEEEDTSIRDVLTNTIIYFQDESIIPTLIAVYQKEIKAHLEECVLEILGSFDTPETNELLFHSITLGNRDKIRLIATRALGKIRLIATRALGKRNAISIIAPLYEVYQNDPNEEIKNLAYKILDEYSIALNFSSSFFPFIPRYSGSAKAIILKIIKISFD